MKKTKARSHKERSDKENYISVTPMQDKVL